MPQIDFDFVISVDAELLDQEIKLHARPFHVALAWMKQNKVSGDVFDDRLWEPLMKIYRTIYPSGDFGIPAMLTGGGAFRDQMYLVRVNVGFGTFDVDPLDCIQISKEELALLFDRHPDQFWRAFYGACDVWDLAYGIDDLAGADRASSSLFDNARSSLAATAKILTGDIDIDSAVQTACLTAELAMKGVLERLGASPAQLKAWSHCLPKLADAIVARRQ